MISFLIDTGSQVTLIPMQLAKSTGLLISPAPSQVIRAYGEGGRVHLLGKIQEPKITLNNNTSSGEIFVTHNDSKPILGMDFLSNLQLVKECTPLSCKSSGFIASFYLKSDCNIDGMHYPARSLSFSMKTMIEEELKRLIAAGIIYPIDNPAISAPIVPVVKQSGASRPIRICGDCSLKLNRIIDRDSYTLPHLEEILQKVNGATVYSVLDLEDAYLQIPLDTASQRLTCISTHLGHFAYTKMHFGRSINLSRGYRSSTLWNSVRQCLPRRYFNRRTHERTP